MHTTVPVNQPVLDGNERKYLLECIETGWISSEGPFVKKFETRMAARMNRRHAVAVTSGTTALDAAVEALGIGLGDEVILPSFTIISCVMQIARSGATPVFVDCDPNHWNMDVSQIEAKITARTKAIMAVHIYGLPVDMDPVLEIALRHGLKVIEDAAEAIGLEYKGRPCGGFGDVSTLSFYPNKHVTTGEGGMVLTDDDALAERVRGLRNLCFQPQRRFIHEELGWNLRMTNIQAAIGLAQLERLDQSILKKREIGRMYQERLADLPGVQLPLPATNYADNIYWVFGLVLQDQIRMDAVEAMKRLSERGVCTRPFFYALHRQPVLLKKGVCVAQNLPVSEYLSEKGFYIPSGLALTEEQIEYVSKVVRAILS
jgi:perosamine synthetase